MTDDDLEESLNSLARGEQPPAEVRELVLGAVRRELHPPLWHVWRRPGLLITSALLLLAFEINFLASAHDRRLVTEFIGGPRLTEAASALEEDVQAMSQEPASWVPNYLQRFGKPVS